jgi:hypothetical protein
LINNLKSIKNHAIKNSRRAKDGTFRGGARPGAGRPPKIPREPTDADVARHLARLLDVGEFDALTIEIRAGSAPALRRLTDLFARAEREARGAGDLFGDSEATP